MNKHDHAGHMLWDDDWCGCKVCEQQWTLDLRKGWVPLSNGTSTPQPQKQYYKPKYKKKVKAGKTISGRLARAVQSQT